jgi:hypothetical protein
MKIKIVAALTLMSFGLANCTASQSQEHPNLIMTKAGVERIREELGNIPLFDASVERARQEVDAEIALGIDTPVPKDFSGGYTHARHKANFFMAQKAGVLFQILEDEKYAVYIRDMLFQYEAMYKDLPVHPQERSYARGKLFWQCLNDSNWLVYMSQAYDSIYDWLSEEERTQLEENLFRPFADFISVGNPRFYNRVHNHSTWGVAAVGMIGLVMGDEELIQRALHGLKDDGIPVGAKDNDGGFLKVEGQKAGFMANIDEPFSPDGYYTEGPYYQRYAMYPFLIFAVGLQNARPDLGVLDYRDGVLLKSINALLNLADADGEFFPLNDGQKGMSYQARELVTAVNVVYHYGGNDPQLLSIAEQQGQVLLDDSGFEVALAVRDGKAQPFVKSSINLSDGADGQQGGVAILRQGNEDLTLVFKYAAQGLSHGHYDKLSFSLYEKGDEVLQDYGLARFVNIGQKGGGNYLPENSSFAKQTIAHNTITQNETSHFEGKYEIGSKHHSELHFYDVGNADVQVASATETNAYPGTEMLRTVAVIKQENFEKPFLLDIFKIQSNQENQYDLPFYFLGQVLQTSFEYDSPASLSALGDKHGYQHLYLEGSGNASPGSSQFSWMGNRKFYTLTSATSASDEMLFTRIGANDPDFNLRRDAALMIRRDGVKDTVFASVVEAHGNYNPVTESAANSNSNIAELKLVYDDPNYTAVSIEDLQGNVALFIVSNKDASPGKSHNIEIDDRAYAWQGPYHYAVE